VAQEKGASSGVAILINRKYIKRIHSYTFVTDLRNEIVRGYLTVVGTYSPEEGKKQERIEFYKILQRHMDTINKNDYLVVGGDFNA
jgi:hypothetical protein